MWMNWSIDDVINLGGVIGAKYNDVIGFLWAINMFINFKESTFLFKINVVNVCFDKWSRKFS